MKAHLSVSESAPRNSDSRAGAPSQRFICETRTEADAACAPRNCEEPSCGAEHVVLGGLTPEEQAFHLHLQFVLAHGAPSACCSSISSDGAMRMQVGARRRRREGGRS